MGRVLIKMERFTLINGLVRIHTWWDSLGVHTTPETYASLGADCFEVLDESDLDKIPSDAYVLLGEWHDP